MQLAALLAQILVQYGPGAYAAWVEIFHMPEPTKADFLSVLDAISKETYEEFIEAAKARRAALVPPIVQP
jgi:hypothetical protein